jgi:heat shock protein HtpX
MNVSKVTIRPRRSMAIFAVLAIVMVILSYVVLLALAVASVYLPYLALASGVANLQLYILLLFGIALAGALLWSMMPRRDKFTPPGPLLERSAHPRLFAELDYIAGSLGEQLPLEVYLIGDMNAFVADRGGVMGFGSRRIMGLGLPLLSLLTISEFRAVLAHEFAHYYGGDTSLGPWVYKTRMAIIRVFGNVGSLGKLARTWILYIAYLVVVTALKWYFKFFMTVTNLISRRQEFRADELACLVAGAQPLISGLRTINGAGSAWPAYWETEVAPLLASGAIPGIGDGFARFVAVPHIAEQVAVILNNKIEKPQPHPYDTHPPLRDRIAKAVKLPAQVGPLDAQPARDLLEDLPATELDFVKTLAPNVVVTALKPITWDTAARDHTLPNWRQTVVHYSAIFQGLTPQSLPDALARLSEITPKIPDPKGRLLTREERAQRAADLLAIGLALALVDHGWQLYAQPGALDLRQGDEHLNPFALVRQLRSGKLKKEEWLNRCAALNISAYPFGPLAAVSAAKPTASA